MKRFPFPLQYSIPVTLLLFSSIAGFYAFQQEVSMANRRVEEQTIQKAKFLGSKTSALLEFIYRTHNNKSADLESANLVVSQLGGEPNLKLAVLLDENDRVILATHYKLRSRHLRETPLTKEAQISTWLSQSRKNLAGQVKISQDRKSLAVFYPVRFKPKSGELRSSRIGVLVLEYDLSAQEQQAWQFALQRSLQTGGILMLLSAIAWFFFERTVTRRAANLVAVSNSWGGGNLSERTQLQGSDELAQIAAAFNQMANQLQQETQNLREANRKRESAEEGLRQIIEGTAAVTGQDFFPALVAHIAKALEVRYVSVSQVTPEGFQVLAFVADGTLQVPESFHKLFPRCTESLQAGQCCIPESIKILYPDQAPFSDLNIESYLGVELQTTEGKLIGNLCIFHDHPLLHPEWAKTLLRIFAARAGSELERYQTSLELEKLNHELEQRVQERTEQLQERELQLQATNAELLRATRLKDEFLANMSHELRTPLNAILGMSESLQEQIFGAINEKQELALKMIERSGSHLLELINEILDLAKIESGQIELDYQPTAIAPLCQLSLAFIKQQAYKKRIQVETQLPEYLPNLMVDERQIRQVLLNLLNNAVKFTPEGGQITLKVEYFPVSTPIAERAVIPQSLTDELSSLCCVRFSVQDTGIGIAPENIHKLFQPFIQIDSALNRQYSGTGLGLALVKNIVELHGGEVGLTSEVGIGSCFTFTLPCAENHSIVATPTIQSETTSESSQFLDLAHKSPIILLAEDNEANIATISSYLTTKGYKIRLAKNGREALEQALAEPPDLILMDVQMPEMDGLTAMQKIRQIPELEIVPIIALTALTMKGDQEKCLQAGANDYLSKPVKLKQLVTMIQKLLLPVY